MSTPLRVLVAEDSEDDTLLLVRQLTTAGFAVEFERVETAAAMSHALDNHLWDLVIGDYDIPAFGGFAALQLVRMRDRDIPFIFVSGSIGEDVAVEAMRAGAQDYVMKGNLRRLIPAIQRELVEVSVRRERRRAEDALRTAETRLQQLLASSTAVLYSIGVTEAGFVPVWVSENIALLLGFSVEEALQPTWWLNHVHPDDLAEVRAELAGLSDQGLSLEYRFRHRDGGYRWIHDQSRLFAGTGDYPRELVGAWLDVTARHRLEDQFRQAQKMEAVGRLAGGIAHDFNNLLSVITSHTDFLKQDLAPDDPRLQDAQAVHHAAMEAAGLTRQLLAFSRQQVLEPRVLNLNRAVEGARGMLARLIGEDVQLVSVLDPVLGSVKADEGQIGQVIMNLAVNARDAMPEGGKLTIETANADMDQEYLASHPAATVGRYIVLAVSDTGMGMDESTKARLFEPFFTTKEVGKGTGLGLATVYGIVKQSGGFIWVYSEPGQGTTFKIYLPRVDTPSDKYVSGAVPPPLQRGNETVLLAEDSVVLRTVARRILEQQGYTVLEAPDGELALQVAAGHAGTIDLLLTDVVMPGMGGRRLAEELTRVRPGLRVLFFSGYTGDAVVRHGVLMATVAYLQKPFSPDSLARKVRQVLDEDPAGAGG